MWGRGGEGAGRGPKGCSSSQAFEVGRHADRQTAIRVEGDGQSSRVCLCLSVCLSLCLCDGDDNANNVRF